MKTISFIKAAMGLWLIAAVTSCGNSSNRHSEDIDTNNATSLVDIYASDEENASNADINSSDDPKDAFYSVKNGFIYPSDSRPAVVDFYADWCPPCRKLHPIFTQMQKEFTNKVDFIRIDVDRNPEIAANYVGQGIPTIAYILPDGRVAGTTEGLLSAEDLRKNILILVEISKK